MLDYERPKETPFIAIKWPTTPIYFPVPIDDCHQPNDRYRAFKRKCYCDICRFVIKNVRYIK